MIEQDQKDYELLINLFVELEDLTESQSFTPTKEACENMLKLIKKLAEAEARYKKLIDLAGHWQDGSCETVSFGWDDATRMVYIHVGKRVYHGDSFEQVLKEIPNVE